MYDTGDWKKKISKLESFDLFRNKYEGWDLVDDQPVEVRIYYAYCKGTDQQRDMNMWADDNIIGYFFSSIIYTESGTPIVRSGDKIGVSFTFQKKEDAMAFKLRWM